MNAKYLFHVFSEDFVERHAVRRAFRLRPMLSALVLLVLVIIFARTLEYVWDQDYRNV